MHQLVSRKAKQVEAKRQSHIFKSRAMNIAYQPVPSLHILSEFFLQNLSQLDLRFFVALADISLRKR